MVSLRCIRVCIVGFSVTIFHALFFKPIQHSTPFSNTPAYYHKQFFMPLSTLPFNPPPPPLSQTIFHVPFLTPLSLTPPTLSNNFSRHLFNPTYLFSVHTHTHTPNHKRFFKRFFMPSFLPPAPPSLPRTIFHAPFFNPTHPFLVPPPPPTLSQTIFHAPFLTQPTSFQ